MNAWPQVTLFISLVLLLGCSQRNEQSESILVVEDPVHHFGEVVQGELLSHTFSVKNSSRHFVQVKSIRTSCKCTVLQEDSAFRHPMAPGESRPLSVAFEAAGYRKQQSSTIIVEYIAGGTTEAGLVRLGLHATVGSDYRLSAEELDFGVLGGGATSAGPQIVEVVSASRRSPVDLLSAHSNDPRVIVQELPNNKFAVSIPGMESATASEISSSILVETSSLGMPRTIVRVRAKVHPFLRVSQELVSVGSSVVGAHSCTLVINTTVPSSLSYTVASDAVTVSSDRLLDEFSTEHLLRLTFADLGRAYSANLHLIANPREGDGVTRVVPLFRFGKSDHQIESH